MFEAHPAPMARASIIAPGSTETRVTPFPKTRQYRPRQPCSRAPQHPPSLDLG